MKIVSLTKHVQNLLRALNNFIYQELIAPNRNIF